MAKSFERLIKRVLTRIGIEASENIRSGVLLELDGGNQAQEIVPVLADQGVIDVIIRGDSPALAGAAVMATKQIEALCLPIPLMRGAKENPRRWVRPNTASV